MKIGRDIIEQFKQWKDSPDRKPILLKGTSAGKAEVEFVLQWGEDIVPVEVKAEDNISGNSLSEYNKKYSPKYRIRFSMLNLQYNGGLLSSPSPLAAWLDKLFKMLA